MPSPGERANLGPSVSRLLRKGGRLVLQRAAKDAHATNTTTNAHHESPHRTARTPAEAQTATTPTSYPRKTPRLRMDGP